MHADVQLNTATGEAALQAAFTVAVSLYRQSADNTLLCTADVTKRRIVVHTDNVLITLALPEQWRRRGYDKG